MTAGYLPASVGGTQVHIRALVHAFDRDHDIRILCRAQDPEDEEYARRSYEHEGVRVETINNTFRDAKNFTFLYRVPGVDGAFAESLDAWTPDLVHVHHLTCLSTGILDELARREIPTVMTLHDFWMVCPRGQRLDSDGVFQDPIDRAQCLACIRRTWPSFFPRATHALADTADREMLAAWDDEILARLRRVDRIIVPSRGYADFFAAWGLDRGRIDVVEHGLDAAAFQGVERASPRDDAKLRVGYLGTVIPSKGAHVLLEAARGLGDRLTVDIHGEFVPYHEDDGYRARLEAAIPDDVEVTLHGRYEPVDVPEILSTFDVLVVPSIWHEAFGLTLREGFLAGVPVIASDHGGLGEAIADGRGLGFRPGDAADLRDKLRSLLDDPALRERLRGQPAWVRTVDAMAEETMRTYEAAVSASRTEGEPTLDPFREPYARAVAAVRKRTRNELLRDAAGGLASVARRLGLRTDIPSLLAALPEHGWAVRDAYVTHRSQAEWLRNERASLEDSVRSREREIALLSETVESERSTVRHLENAIDKLRNDFAAESEVQREERNAALTEQRETLEELERLRSEFAAETEIQREERNAALAEQRETLDELERLRSEFATETERLTRDLQREVDAQRDEKDAALDEQRSALDELEKLSATQTTLLRDFDLLLAESDRAKAAHQTALTQIEETQRDRDARLAESARAWREATDAYQAAQAAHEAAVAALSAAEGAQKATQEQLARARSELAESHRLLHELASSRWVRVATRGELKQRLRSFRR